MAGRTGKLLQMSDYLYPVYVGYDKLKMAGTLKLLDDFWDNEFSIGEFVIVPTYQINPDKSVEIRSFSVVVKSDFTRYNAIETSG